MMETLTLNDGTILANSHALLSGRTLWFYLGSVTFTEAFELMNDPNKTRRIISNSYGDEQEYNGYTDLFCLRREESGIISGGLTRI